MTFLWMYLSQEKYEIYAIICGKKELNSLSKTIILLTIYIVAILFCSGTSPTIIS